MNQSYVYEEDEAEEGLTFKKVGHFFKKGWLRMLIYVVALALIVTAVAVPIKVLYKSEEVAQTSIEFIYDGIEEGLDPNGGTLNTDNIISTTVLNSAVKAAKLDDIVTDISKLRGCMRVEGVETDEYVKLVEAAADGDATAANTLRNYTMIPTRFNIIISEPSELGLSDDQAKQLLDEVVKSYYADFQKRFSPTDLFVADTFTLAANEQFEFIDIYDMYTLSLASVRTYLTEIAAEDPSFVSTENSTSFNQLLTDLNVLTTKYALFNADIQSKNIWRDRTSARNALIASRTEINNKLDPLNDYITVLKDQIANIRPNTATSDNGGAHSETVSYPPEYFVYQERLDEANRQARDYNVQLKNIETRLEKLPEGDTTATDEALIGKAVQTLTALEQETSAFVEKVNATVRDYYNTTFLSSSVKKVQPSAVTRRSSDLNLLIIYLVAIIVGIIAASVVTGVKIAKANNAVKRAAAEDSEKPAEAEASENSDEAEKAQSSKKSDNA